MTEYKYCQLRQRVSIPALRSSLLDQIEVNIFFWYLPKHSQFPSASYLTPRKDYQALSWPSNRRYVSSSRGFFLPVDAPTSSTPVTEEELSVCPSRPHLDTHAPDLCFWGGLTPFRHCNNFFFIVSPKLKKSNNNNKKYHVWTSLVFFLGYLSFS